jgi:hypothetical protein
MEDGGRSPMRVHLNAREAFHTDAQIKRYLLCNECEQLFSARGESQVSLMWATHDNFPLLEQLRCLPSQAGRRFSMLKSADIPPRILDSLFYFAASVVWRSNCWDWGRYSSEHKGSLGPSFEKKFVSFLKGENSEIKGARLLVTVNTNAELNGMFGFPYYRRSHSCGFHRFDVLGLHFCFLLGDNIHPSLSRPFEVMGSKTIVLLSDVASTPAFESMAKRFYSMFPDE